MKNLKVKSVLVLVLLFSLISCTNDDFEEIPVFEMEDMELQSNHMSDGEEDNNPVEEEGKDD